MPLMHCQPRTLAAFGDLVPEIVYVMCGARGETRNRLLALLPQARLIGFEPDAEECQRLRRAARPGYTYHDVAVAGRDEQRTLYLTRERACSSLLQPNAAFFGRFLDCAPQIEVEQQRTVETVSLDSFLPRIGVAHVDFLKLDTQGTELEILQGASHLIAAGVVGIQVEVEFAPIYQGQPLFSDLDGHLRQLGFMLFDLSRNRYRRSGIPRECLTRGQLLWGDAIYLRDYGWFAAESKKQPIFSLCLIAAALGFHDYALEVMDFLLQGGIGSLSSEETGALQRARDRYLADLRKSAWGLRTIHRLGLKKGMKLLGKVTGLADRVAREPAMTNFSWAD